MLFLTLRAGFAKDIADEDFKLAEGAGGLGTVFRGDVQKAVFVSGY